MACDPETNPQLLWEIARERPDLRRWIVANPKVDPHLVEYIAQNGGPGVVEAVTALLDALDADDQ
ncbi:hypothetical protein [uncultured Bifidobacterium sp.]|uniref:variant leucine-rich repeat-containing protein n=1 Tax=uncultured Bifidobacterium sp. TaxID=165187 RepID=UPI0026198A8F|nr:hypothetical protein [uncultured Bifidobacterium sp.]